MTYKGVLFDLDGTLVHTKPEYRYILISKVLNELGFNTFNKKGADRFWFETKRNLAVMENFGIINTESFWRTYFKLETPEFRKDYIESYPDVDIINELTKKGYKIGIVTGAPAPIAHLEVDFLRKHLENYVFDNVVVSRRELGFKHKPHPGGLEQCLKNLKLKNNEAIYVGNAKEDALTASNAGVPFVLIDRGEYKFNLDGLKMLSRTDSLYTIRELLE